MEKVQQNNKEYLENIYQAKHWIAWFDLDYGGNLEGIFTAACPPKALHAQKRYIFAYSATILQFYFE